MCMLPSGRVNMSATKKTTVCVIKQLQIAPHTGVRSVATLPCVSTIFMDLVVPILVGNVHPDKSAHNKSSRQDLHCPQEVFKCLISSKLARFGKWTVILIFSIDLVCTKINVLTQAIGSYFMVGSLSPGQNCHIRGDTGNTC